MQKNENNLNSSNITNESKELSLFQNLQILPQLEKDICILINYIRTNPLDFSNNLIKNSKNKNLTEDQINLIKFLEEKYNKDPLLPFHEVPEISLAAKNLLNIISQNESTSINKGQNKLKASSLNLRTRLSNYGIRTGRIFSNVIFGIEKPEDIVNHILKGENGRNMLLSDKMKFIGIGCCLLPSNKVCAVIDIVQDFLPFKQSRKNNVNVKYNINSLNNKNTNNEKENNLEHKMNIVINNTNHCNNNNDYFPNILNNNQHNNQRKKNIINENNNNNMNVYKTPEMLTSTESSQQKSYKSYNIIINNNKIIPIRNNLNNITENKDKDENENYFNLRDNKEIKFEINSCKVANKSKSVYGIKLKSGNRGNSNINRYQKLNRKEKLEILHKINQRKNNNSMVKNNTDFENLIPLSPNYSKNKKKLNSDNEYLSPISPYYSKKIYSNVDSDSNNYEFNETMPNYISPKLDNDFRLSDIKNDLIIIKNQLKEELKLEVKNELKNEIKQKYEDTKENPKKNHNRNDSKCNIIYHKRNKSDFFMKNKKENISVQKKEIKQNNYQSFDSNNKNKLYINEQHRIKNKNEIKKLIRLYNKEKDIKRNKNNNINETNDIIYSNKIVKNKISNLFFVNKSNNNSRIITGISNNIKGLKNLNDKRNLFLIKYQKVIPKDQTFKLTKNKTSNTKSISKLSIRKDNPKLNNNPINDKQIIKENNEAENENVYIINSYRNRSKQNKKMKEQSVELYLNDENYLMENKRYKTPKKNLKQLIKMNDDIELNYEDKSNIIYKYKTLSFNRYKNYKI